MRDKRLAELLEAYESLDEWNKTRLELALIRALLKDEPQAALTILFRFILARFAPLLLALLLAMLIWMALLR